MFEIDWGRTFWAAVRGGAIGGGVATVLVIGKRLVLGSPRCPRCNAPVHARAKTCLECGRPLHI